MTQKILRALVIDDQADNRKIFSTILESLGVTTETASTGEFGVSLIKEKLSNGVVFDLIILDIMMPGISGIEAARQIRSLPFKGPLLAFSAEASSAFKKSAREAGIDHYFVKTSFNRKLAGALLLQFCGVDGGALSSDS